VRSEALVSACALLACAAAAQPPLALEIQLESGERVLQVGPGRTDAGGATLVIGEPLPGRYRLQIQNRGRPRWILGARMPGDDLFFRRLSAAIPAGYVIKNWEAKDCVPDPSLSRAAAPLGVEIWHLVLDGSRRDPHQNVPKSKEIFFLEGGTGAFWDVVRPDDVLEPLPADPVVIERCRRWRGMGPFREEVLPRLVRLRELMTASAGSSRPSVGRRDLGWLALNWHQRFAGGRLPAARGWFNFGSLIGADGHTNHNYDPEEACIETFLRTGQRGAYELALTLALAKVHQGLYQTDTDSPVAYRWAYEKGANPGRPGDYRFPEPSHEWDSGCLMAAALSGDADLVLAMRRRGDALLGIRIPALRAFGARKVGWLLRNLRAHHHFTGEERFLARARELVDMVFATARPDETWLSNDIHGRNPLVDPWQMALLYSEMEAFGEQGLTGSAMQRLPDFVRWVLDKGTETVDTPLGPALRGGYIYNLETGALSSPWPSVAIWFLPLLARRHAESDGDRQRYEACLTAAFGLAFQGWSNASVLLPNVEAQIDCSAYGAHGRKTMSQLLIFAEDRYLPR
jgi:hypothetical protein